MDLSVSNSFGQWLKKRRKALDLTQDELAQRVGCATITLQKIESDLRRPSKQLAEALAKQVRISAEQVPEFVKFARAKLPMDPSAPFRQTTGAPALWNRLLDGLTNLPVQPTHLIGRDQDVATARKRLVEGNTRLLTLVGPPGVGKTRLAIQIAASLLDEFADGVYFVSLAPVSDPNLIPAVIARSLGVNQVGERSFADRLQEYLRDKQMLLLLDNFEHVVTAAPFVADLLSACPWLSILATSRAPLSIRIERQFHVKPLALPDELGTDVNPSDLMRYSALELFVERARAAESGFALTRENARVIVDICSHLDGLPLAIELVAARSSFLQTSSLLEQLTAQDVLHTGELRDLVERHHTLYHAIDWSCALLAPVEQRLLARLSVFHGGWTLKTAERIMSDQPAPRVQEALKSLVGNHLVVSYENHGEPRFRMLETIWAYARERLAEAGEDARVRQRHAEYYLALAEETDRHLRTAEQIAWLDRLEAEHSNLQAALSWFIDEAGDAESALRLVVALVWFWVLHSHISEGRQWLTRALEAGSNADRILQANAMSGAGNIAWLQGDVAVARSLLEESVAIHRALEAPRQWDLAWALSGLAMVAAYQADEKATRAASEEAIAAARRAEDQWIIALSLCTAGEACMMRHDYAAARACYEESLALFRGTGDGFGVGICLLDWGYMDSILGHYDDARARLEEAVARIHQIGERWMRALALNVLGQVVQQRGDYELAAALYSESLDLLRKMGLEASIADVLFNLAQVAKVQGHSILAKRLHTECLALFSKQGNEDRVAKCRTELASLDVA